MSIVVFQHIHTEGPAALGRALQDSGHRLRTIKLYDGDPVPSDLDDVDGVVSMGGPMNVDQAAQHAWIDSQMAYLKAAHDEHVPIVGICLGAQLIAAALGGKVATMTEPEVGWQNIRMAFPGTIDPIHTGLGWDTMQFHLHGQEVTELPPGAAPLARSRLCKNQAFKVGLTTYAFQYHFEWDRLALDTFVDDPLVIHAGGSPESIRAESKLHYEDYRRLGDRLCNTIATILMRVPVHKS